MTKKEPHYWRLCALLAFTLSLAACSGGKPTFLGTPITPPNPVGSNLTLISSDPFTIGPGQHATEVEPHMIANGNTIVAAFQTGRIAPGGATDIGWATSTDAGTTWTHGFLPGITTGEGSGLYDAASDPAVAYDAKHQVWMISSLPLSATVSTPAVLVSLSADGINWANPVNSPTTKSSDKNWIVCDNWPASPFYGNCYLEWDDPLSGINGDEIFMSTSSDGGVNWLPPTPTSGGAEGIGGQPLVQPNGTVVVPIESTATQVPYMWAYRSTDGGATWSAPVTITQIQTHADAGGIRSGPLPSAAIDGTGTVWVVWEDCRFRTNCTTNDLVYSTSSDGITWSAVTRIPIDDTSSTVDHFIPGIAIDPLTSGATAHVALHYYYYSQSNCTVTNCQLFVGYISSANGGATWNAPVAQTGAMLLSWLPNSQNGLMVGDYIATVFTNGVPPGIFAVAQANSGTTYNESMYTGQGLTVKASGKQLSSANDRPLHNLSDKIEREAPERGVPPQGRRSRRK